jgi:hypothetical protein
MPNASLTIQWSWECLFFKNCPNFKIYILNQKYLEQKEAVELYLVAFSDGHTSF